MTTSEPVMKRPTSLARATIMATTDPRPRRRQGLGGGRADSLRATR